jgi:hypothetical protein
VTAQWARSFQQKEHVMLKIEPYNRDTDADPAASFATDDEIAIADRLRHQLEERYLAPSASSSPSPVRTSNGD